MRVLVLLLFTAALSVWSLGCAGDDPTEQVDTAPTADVQQTQAEQEEGAEQQAQDDPQEQRQTQVEPQAEAEVEQAESTTAVAQPDQSDQSATTQAEQADSAAETQQSSPPQAPEAQSESPSPISVTLGDERTAKLLIPSGIDPSQPLPLVLLLHGYSSNSFEADAYFQFSSWVEEGQFGLLLPNGTVDEIGNQFWNATNECCDIFGAEPDDVGYLTGLIAEAGEYANVAAVFAVGHSNGGFMAYRLACEAAPGLRAIVSLAGAAFHDPTDCRVPEPLSVLQIHGDRDAIVLYHGGRLPTHPDPDRAPIPSASESVKRWAARANCSDDTFVVRSLIDTDSSVEGVETAVQQISADCVNGLVMELWTIQGGGHIPWVWNTDFTPSILGWLAERYESDTASASSTNEAVIERTLGPDRSATLLYPSSLDEPAPLIVSLHGYQGEAEAHDWYFGLSERIAEYGFALITPQGTADSRGYAFWNATNSCCDFDGSGVDDVGWISGLVAEAASVVDISGVYVVGYSNGGFMSYRLACDGLEQLVAIVSLAGSSFGDPERCADAPPVSVLQIHGTADWDIPYDGILADYSPDEGGYPGATEIVERWAARASCDLEQVETLPSIDLDMKVIDAETTRKRFRSGCIDGITIELWTMAEVSHYPLFQDDWPDWLLHWLLNESRAN